MKMKWITGNARQGFYKDLWVLMLPIAVQNLITAGVNMADVVMVGQLNQTALSASSLAGQVAFILNFVYFGMVSAVTIMAAQYWGKGDREVLAKILGLGLYISLAVAVTAAVLSAFAPRTVMRFWTNDPELIEVGSKYLRLASFSYFFSGLTQPYIAVMRSCERVKFSMVLSMITLTLNVILNALLIFGLFGFPALGIEGAAIATSISRGVELLICLVDFGRQKILPKSLKNMFSLPRTLLQDFRKFALPAFLNDVLWGFAYNMNAVIMGRLGTDMVAANSMVVVVRDLLTTVGFGISSAAAIMLGKELGQGQPDVARKDASSLIRVTLMCSAVSGVLLLISFPWIPSLAKVSEVSAGYMKIMLLMNIPYQTGMLLNTLVIASILRCGGDTRYGMILDITTMWGYAVPVGLLTAFVFKLPPLIVYAFMCTDEFVKMPFALWRYRSGKWLRNITREHMKTE
ncbi:MAG: MATE family efflux transporter [Lachnospiraceae bacterium]|nr:MATE family efflux transporter [Lachnospiraceae bacterium]